MKKRRKQIKSKDSDLSPITSGEDKGVLAISQVRLVEQVSKAPCSIEFSRDAKGQARWAIKLYGEEHDMDRIVRRVLEIDRQLHEKTS